MWLLFTLLQIASALWWYYFSKFIEFFDTVSTACVYVYVLSVCTHYSRWTRTTNTISVHSHQRLYLLTGILYSAKEGQASHFLARLSPCIHVFPVVDRYQVGGWRTM